MLALRVREAMCSCVCVYPYACLYGFADGVLMDNKSQWNGGTVDTPARPRVPGSSAAAALPDPPPGLGTVT